MNRRVLFVDDEPKILDGLKRMLRSMRKEWDMHFSNNAIEALKLLEEESFDVVVSDMRMPCMDGAAFLTEVMERFPQVARLALSGQADEELIMRSVRPVHQYLSKPCEAEALKTTILRVCALRDQLNGEDLKQLTSQLKSIPSRPTLYAKIIEELESENASIKKVGQIISSDMGMTAKILHMVNSAFFGLRRNVSDPAHAVNLLGIDTVKNLVLSIQVFSAFEDIKIPGFSMEKLWQHSANTALFAKEIARSMEADKETVDDAFGAGMLHDVGCLIMASSLPEQYAKTFALAEAANLNLRDAEMKVFGANHAQVGAHLLGLWGLPDTFVEAVAFHHDPGEIAGAKFTSLTAVHLANVYDSLINPSSGGGIAPEFCHKHLEAIGVAGRLEEWQTLCETLLGGVDEDQGSGEGEKAA